MCLAKFLGIGREHYIRGPENLGVGMAAMARISTNPRPQPGSFYSPRYMVKGSFAPLAGGVVKLSQRVQEYSILGNGSALAGQMAMQELSRLTEGNKK